MSRVVVTENDRNAINRAIAAAESKTAAEIVPVVAESSGRYDRAEDLCGLWLGSTCLVAVWILLPTPLREPGSWGGPSLMWYPFSLVGAVVIGFLLGVLISNRLTSLRRLFTPRREQEQEVANRARQIFFDQRVHHTQAQGGILLYVSLFEHRAAIMADQFVLEALTQPTIDTLVSEFTARLKDETLTDAFVESRCPVPTGDAAVVGDGVQPLAGRFRCGPPELHPDGTLVHNTGLVFKHIRGRIEVV